MKIVVAVDQTEYGNQIVDAVIKRHWPTDTAVKILTVLESPQWEQLDTPECQRLAEEVFHKRREQALQLMQKYRTRIENRVENCSVHVDIRRGSARSRIYEALTEWQPDKILLGVHGYSPNRLLGSVPRALCRQAPCCVELIRLKQLAHLDHHGKKKKSSKVAS